MANGTMRRLTGGLRSAMRSGLPLALIAVVAIGAVIALLISANSRTNAKPLAYAEISVSRGGGCVIDPVRSYNVNACFALGPRAFLLTSQTSLRHTTPVVSEGSCCADAVGATVTGDREVTVAFRRLRGVVRATVVLP
jgi:hypothetical protein